MMESHKPSLAMSRLSASKTFETGETRMKLYTVFSVLGVFVWIGIAVWLIRLGMGLDHFHKDQIPVMIVSGIGGGIAGWYFVRREAKKRLESQAR
jgi:membrane protein DedA with SNARE-associated domain